MFFLRSDRQEAGIPKDDHRIEEILGALRNMADGQERVAIGDILEAVGGRGHGPLLLIPALIEISPLGGIPGVPTFLALIIALFSLQIVMGHDHMWLPSFVERRSISGAHLEGAVGKVQPVGAWLDRWFHERWERLTGAPARRVGAVVSLLLCLSVPPLELFPFASTAPMAAIALFGLAMTLRDGLVMALAFAASAAALVVGGWLAWAG